MPLQQALQQEAERLHKKLVNVGYNEGYCKIIAPLTLKIEQLKKEKNAVVLAHSYQTPDIVYSVADFIGDSYQLSIAAQKTDAEVIVFSGVRFMAETAKILNPSKTVLLPAPGAGCSLADAITGEDVRALKKKYPGRPVVSYVNTTAEVKAESDSCCTSSNALKIVESFAGDELIFLPDKFMMQNLQEQTSKKLIGWDGTCIVHEDFSADKIDWFRKQHKGVKVLSHSECPPSVTHASDYVGGTNGMIDYVEKTEAPSFMIVTECGLADRMRVEHPEKAFIGMCSLCPYMKMNTLPMIEQVLRDPKDGQIILVDEGVRVKAEKALMKMFEISNAS